MEQMDKKFENQAINAHSDHEFLESGFCYGVHFNQKFPNMERGGRVITIISIMAIVSFY